MAWTKVKSGGKADVAALTISEVTENNSSKELALSDVGEAGFFEIERIRIELAATATVGTRTLVCKLLSAADDVIHEVYMNANTKTASQSGVWELHPNADTTVTSPQYVNLIPGLSIFAGQKLLIEDSAAIDAAADDLIIHVTGKVRYAKAI